MGPADRAHQEALLSDEVYRRLKDYILSCILSPPERLHLTQLSRHFGVSITPIREALIRLSAEQLVDLKPGRGFFYRDFIPREQIQLGETLLTLLRHALEQRARRPRKLTFSAVFGEESGEPPNDLHRQAQLRERFYCQIANPLDNGPLADLVRNLSERTHISRLLWLEQRSGAPEEFDALMALFQAGDYPKVLARLSQCFEDKARSMDSLAKLRMRQIYAANPLLRPA
jgi:DNA-binding GntR family transcriptional regulator